MDDTFVCENCGREFPKRRLKEVVEAGANRRELCPECLDERMNRADAVQGGIGEEKPAAAYVDEAAPQGAYGRRE